MQDDDLDQDETIILLVEKFGRFLKKDKIVTFGKERKFLRKREASTLNINFTFFEYWKKGQMKADYPSLVKKISLKGKKESKSKKAYVAWNYNEVSLSSDI